MAKPFLPTPQELTYQYMEVNFTDKGNAYVVEGKDSVFTLGDLKNGRFGLTENQLESARTIRPGNIKKITHSYKPRNQFGLYRLDPALEIAIDRLEQQRAHLKLQIDHVAGQMIRHREHLLDQIKLLKAKRTK